MNVGNILWFCSTDFQQVDNYVLADINKMSNTYHKNVHKYFLSTENYVLFRLKYQYVDEVPNKKFKKKY